MMQQVLVQPRRELGAILDEIDVLLAELRETLDVPDADQEKK